jgi:cyanophycin synthetase
MFFLNLDKNKSLYGNGFILEKQQIGGDYRLMMIGGKFAFAIKRTPPFITGDGSSTIKDLIHAKNQDLRRKNIENQVQKIVQIDQETNLILKKNNLTLSSVLDNEQVLQLKSISNLSVGGDRVLVEESEIHQGVIEMCENISKKLNLFSIGVDYITEDISKPPEVGKDAIIEFNYNPQLSAVWAPMFIERFLKVIGK